MLAFVSEYIERYQVLPSTGRLVVAVSGGADSLALLHLLRQLTTPSMPLAGLQLHVAHFDHHLRPDSGNDAQAVAHIAQAWQLPYSLGEADVRQLAREQKYSLEEAARIARYQFLRTIAQGDPIALAHHKDDQVESLLLHWLRGGGLSGMIGMQPVYDDLRRPLLAVNKQEILAYCQQHHLQPLEDESNADPRFLRNRIRHELLPLLEDLNPGIRETITRTADVLNIDVHWIEMQVQQAWPDIVVSIPDTGFQLDLKALSKLPLSIQRHLLRGVTARLCEGQSPLEARHYPLLEALWQPPYTRAEKYLNLPGHLLLKVQADKALVIKQTNYPSSQEKIAETIFLDVPGSIAIPGTHWSISARFLDQALFRQISPLLQKEHWSAVRELLPGDPQTVYLDAQSITYFPTRRLLIRSRQTGDRMQPLGMARLKKIQDIFVDKHITRSERESIPLICSQEHPLWLAGVQLDHRCRLRASTSQILSLSLHKQTRGNHA